MAIVITENDKPLSQVYSFKKSFVYLVSLVAALGGLLFGFDLVIISGTITFFSDFFQLNEIQKGLAVGCINLGCALGALVSGKLSDSLGRRKLLLLCAFLFAVTGFGTGWATSFLFFIFFRMLSGVAVGVAALVCPMYIAEISPASLRGRLVTFYQLAIVSGILLAYISNYFLLDTGENNWRWMFSSQTIPSILFFIGLHFVPESPRWLVGKKRDAEAELIFKKIGGCKYAQEELRSVQLSFSNVVKEHWKDILKINVRSIIVLGVIIAVFSQIVGQNSILSYAPEIFQQAGLAKDSSFQQSIILGLIFFFTTLIAMFTVDKGGRRKLLKYGSFLLFVDAVSLAMCFYFNLSGMWTLLFVFAFIGIYGATIGPITWVALSEIFPNRIRGNAMACATLALWIANFFTTASFPVMRHYLGLPLTFVIHALICSFYLMYIIFNVPETKGKSLEEIEKLLT